MTTNAWAPVFESQDWIYQSFLVTPSAEESAAPPLPGTVVPVTARKWAMGQLSCGATSQTPDGYAVSGTLVFVRGVQLAVELAGSLGADGAPATLKGTGTGLEGPTKGAVYDLTGWVVPQAPDDPKVLRVEGSVRAVRGPDTHPGVELGGMPVGTVGTFVIVAKGP